MNNLHMLLAMQDLLYYTVVAVCLVTLPSLVIGLLVSIFQAATQINEMTLTFIPKMVVTFGLMFVFGPWLLSQLGQIMRHMLTNLPLYIR